MNIQEPGALIRQLRIESGLTQEFVSSKLGVSRTKYLGIEAGKSKLSISDIRILADLYEISPSEIVEGKIAQEVDITLVSNVDLSSLTEDVIEREIEPRVNPVKLLNVLLYIPSQVGAKPNVGETVLYKLLYFIDFDFYEKNGRSITGLSYVKNRFGPTPTREFSSIVASMKEAGELEVIETQYFSHLQKKYLPVKNASLSSLTADEIKHIDGVLDRLSDKTANELSELSHKDMPWIATNLGKRIDYQLAMYRTDETSVREYDDDL